MSNREMRLKYIIDLASNVAPKARDDARVVEESQRRMEQAVARTERGMGQLDNRLGSLGRNSTIERQVTFMDRLAASMDRVHQRAQQLKTTLASGFEMLPEIGAAAVGGYYGGKAVLQNPLRAYSNLESATTDLRVSLMDAKGNIDKSFGAIAAEAVALGNQLPGSTKDFMGAARALVEQGTPGSVIAGGGLRASSYFGVLMGMDQTQAAETIAKVREAYGLKDNELVKMADLMQRGKFAFGIKPDDFRQVAAYAAPTYNAMGLTGLGNAKQLMAIQGMAASVGLESSSFGTNFSMMLSRLSQIDGRTNKHSAEAKAIKALLNGNGIEMSFYGEDGKFSGVENMMTQMAKLRKLSPIEQQKTLNLMFGVEGGRPAQIMVQRGLEMYRDNLRKIDDQASIDQRITEKMDTFAAKLEALGGTIENVMASMAKYMGDSSKPGIDSLNSAAGSAGEWFGKHPVVGSALLGTAAIGATALGGRTLLSMFSRFGGRGAGAAAAAVEGVAPAVAGVSRLARFGGIAGKVMPLAMLGLESYDVLTDDNLTRMGKARGLGMAGAGAAGGWYGAAAGAALGTMVLPGIGTAIGGMAGGALGYWGGREALGALWRQDPKRDFVRLTDPRGMPIGQSGAGGATVQLGEGKITVAVTVDDHRASANTSVQSPLPLIRIDAGATNPGSFSGGAVGAW